MQHDTDDSPWHDPPSSSTTPAHAEVEWTRLSSSFQNAGYRDGITAGKEGALQQGFDAGFAQSGAPRGRELGVLRGLANALLLHLSRAQAQAQAQSQIAIEEEGQEQEQARVKAKAKAATEAAAAAAIPAVREIVDALAAVRFADIAPAPALAPPEEAEEHEHEHTHGSDEAEARCEEGEVGRSSTSTGLGPSAGCSTTTTTTTIEDVRALRVRLEALLRESGLDVNVNNLNLEPPAA